MRIRILQTPTVGAVDGIDLRRYVRGRQYEVGQSLAALFLSEGWAEPVPSEEPAIVAPVDPGAEVPHPPNLIREGYPPYFEGPPNSALDRRRRPRQRGN